MSSIANWCDGSVDPRASSLSSSAPDGSTLLVDLPHSNGGGGYVTIFFDGDPDGAPMYLELNQFPGHSAVIIGTSHSVG